MADNEKTAFITEVIDKCIDNKTHKLREPTKKTLVFILKWLKKLWVETENKPKKDVEHTINTFINQSDIDIWTKKNAHKIFDLFIQAYPKLYGESVQDKKTVLHQEIERIDARKKEIDKERQNLLSLFEEQQAKLDTFTNHTYPERINDVREQFKYSDDIHREKVEGFAKNPEKIRFGVDAQWDVYIELVEINKKIKWLNLQSLPENMKITWTDKELLSETQSTWSQECVFLWALKSKEFDDCLKAYETHGYYRNADKEDEVMKYLAEQFWMTYNNKPTWEYQPIMKIRMALLHRLWWDFMRRGKNWDNLWELFKKDIDNIQIANLSDDCQRLDRRDLDDYDASVMLVAW